MIYIDLAPGLFGEDKYSRAGTDGDRFLGACTLVSLSARLAAGGEHSDRSISTFQHHHLSPAAYPFLSIVYILMKQGKGGIGKAPPYTAI
jgi:hypothetical protein